MTKNQFVGAKMEYNRQLDKYEVHIWPKIDGTKLHLIVTQTKFVDA